MGLFATVSFKPNELIIDYKGELLTESDFKSRYPDESKCRYVFQVGTRIIDAVDPKLSNVARYINHQSWSKCNARLTRHGNIRAKKHIRPGQEITMDYGPLYNRHKFSE
jgi:SET domain-containing protein